MRFDLKTLSKYYLWITSLFVFVLLPIAPLGAEVELELTGGYFSWSTVQYRIQKEREKGNLRIISEPRRRLQLEGQTFPEMDGALRGFFMDDSKRFSVSMRYSKTTFEGASKYGRPELPYPQVYNYVNYSREGSELGGLYYFIPGRLGLGLGIRQTRDLAVGRPTHQVLTGRDYRSTEKFVNRGPQFQAEYNLPLDPTSILSFRLAGYYAPGIYKYEQTEWNYSNYPTGANVVYTGTGENARGIRRGVDASIVFSVQITPRFGMNFGLRYHESSIRITGYRDSTFKVNSLVSPENDFLASLISSNWRKQRYGRRHKDFYNQFQMGVTFNVGRTRTSLIEEFAREAKADK